MGNNQSKTDSGSQAHQRLGLVTVTEAEDKDTNEIFSTMSLVRPIQSEKAVEGWLKQISRIDDTQTREVLLLPLKHEFQKQGMCGSSGVVHLTYQNYPFILENQIKNRLSLNKFFLETEMWYLLYNMIRAGNKFQRIKNKIGDVHPANILINDDGQVKLISTCSLPGEMTNFDKIVEVKEATVFLAPEELDQAGIAKGEYPNAINPCRAEVFSIGLTLLSSATLQNCNGSYDKSKGIKLNSDFIQRLINRLSERYSVLLTETIAGMLNHNPQQRRHCSEIYQMLFPYQNQILQLQPFNIPARSSSVHQSSMLPSSVQYNHQSYAPNTNTGPVYRQPNIQTGSNFGGPIQNTYQTGGHAYLSQEQNHRF